MIFRNVRSTRPAPVIASTKEGPKEQLEKRTSSSNCNLISAWGPVDHRSMHWKVVSKWRQMNYWACMMGHKAARAAMCWGSCCLQRVLLLESITSAVIKVIPDTARTGTDWHLQASVIAARETSRYLRLELSEPKIRNDSFSLFVQTCDCKQIPNQ